MIRPDLFKTVMRRHAASVVLISSCVNGRKHFVTATSFTPVSLEPPLVLFCLHRNGDTHDLVGVGTTVGINLLSYDQEALSRRFASKGPERYEVSDLHLVLGPDGVPLLSKACASMEVKLIEQHKGGDHSIFVGQITWAAAQSEASPLLYHSGQYASVAESASKRTSCQKLARR
jgi:flavin reductase (DIM6/NTAB) family NADH-FMN oxidoreductase RutF